MLTVLVAEDDLIRHGGPFRGMGVSQNLPLPEVGKPVYFWMRSPSLKLYQHALTYTADTKPPEISRGGILAGSCTWLCPNLRVRH